MKTIKQIAEEIGVSKQAVEKRIARNADIQAHITRDEKGVKQISEEGEKLIKAAYEAIDTPTDTSTDKGIDTSTDGSSHIDTLIAMLQNELDLKNKQIEDLIDDKEYLKNQLNASQFINAGNVQTKLLEAAQPPEEKKPGFFRRFFGKD